jgi:hypothetical protein
MAIETRSSRYAVAIGVALAILVGTLTGVLLHAGLRAPVIF